LVCSFQSTNLFQDGTNSPDIEQGTLNLEPWVFDLEPRSEAAAAQASFNPTPESHPIPARQAKSLDLRSKTMESIPNTFVAQYVL
jgi:hypothetical protein